MGHEQDIWIFDQTRVYLWFFFKYVEPNGPNLPTVQGFYESSFVEDGATGRINYDDAIFHLLELWFADDVTSGFLIEFERSS